MTDENTTPEGALFRDEDGREYFVTVAEIDAIFAEMTESMPDGSWRIKAEFHDQYSNTAETDVCVAVFVDANEAAAKAEAELGHG